MSGPLLRLPVLSHHLCQFPPGWCHLPDPQLLSPSTSSPLLRFSPTSQLLPCPTASRYTLRFSSASPLGLKRKAGPLLKPPLLSLSFLDPHPSDIMTGPTGLAGAFLLPHASVRTLGSHADHFPPFPSLLLPKCVGESTLPGVLPAATGPPPRASY